MAQRTLYPKPKEKTHLGAKPPKLGTYTPRAPYRVKKKRKPNKALDSRMLTPTGIEQLRQAKKEQVA